MARKRFTGKTIPADISDLMEKRRIQEEALLKIIQQMDPPTKKSVPAKTGKRKSKPN